MYAGVIIIMVVEWLIARETDESVISCTHVVYNAGMLFTDSYAQCNIMQSTI